MSQSTKHLFCSTRDIGTITFHWWSLMDFVWHVLMTWFVYRYTTSWRLWWWCSYWLLVYVAAGWTTLIDLGVVAAGQDNLNFNFLYFSLLMRTGLGPRPVPVCQLKLEARPCLYTPSHHGTQHRRNCLDYDWNVANNDHPDAASD